MNRNQKLEEFLELEAEIIEIQDGISGMTVEVDAFVKQKDIEIKAIYDAGNARLDELDKQKQDIINEGTARVKEIEAQKKDAVDQLNAKVSPIYEKMEKEIFPKKNELYLSLMGIPQVILPKNSKTLN